MISLFGYGKTTGALAKKLQNCLIFDDKFLETKEDEFGNKLLPPKLFDPQISHLEIPSPGFPPNHELVKKAKNLISEYDYFYDVMPTSVWITGTNGKTTTTQMLGHLLAQYNGIVGGNIGEPLANLDTNATFWLLETSSFTLHYTKKAKPNILVILPIKDDHISWHGSFESYANAKLSPMDRMSEGSVVILPQKYKDYPTMAMKITYEDEIDLARKMGIEPLHVDFQRPFLMDAIMALSVQKILCQKIDYTLINSFKTDAHKLEEFQDSMGRVWVNDTKGTNVDATIEALKRYAKKEILIILGGDDKGAPLDELFLEMKPLHVKIFAIGSNTQKIVDFAQQINKEVHACYELQKAVALIKPMHTKDTIALLSPAAASLDQFSSYIERGEMFKNLALN
ncbi:MAG TPA: UDP-N-acetylmuramoyl-L-alanine--D-glutamate ligase [Sulfurospirillum sp. UBA11407]|nr:MAG TPA: UDP-N-acetylmuramoyl-L-alanine--D-glutamate ligase [Sulfurospirillum sp. UBA11407]